jgi:hypothetical protein
LKGATKPQLEMSGQRFVGGFPGMQGAGKPALCCKECREAMHLLRQSVERIILLGKRCRGLRAGVYLAAKNGGDQIRPLREMTVDRPNSKPCLGCNLAGRGIDAGGSENVFGGLK